VISSFVITTRCSFRHVSSRIYLLNNYSLLPGPPRPGSEPFSYLLSFNASSDHYSISHPPPPTLSTASGFSIKDHRSPPFRLRLHRSAHTRFNSPHTPGPQTPIGSPLLALCQHFGFRHVFPFGCLSLGVIDVLAGPDCHSALDPEVSCGEDVGSFEGKHKKHFRT
jgi:hypothetical protein